MGLRILFAAPGHYMLHRAGGARVVLEVCAALAREAEVTAAFRALADPSGEEAFPIIAIQPEHRLPPEAAESSNAIRGLNPIEWLGYARALDRFADRWADRVDCAIEYGWRGSGLLSRAFARRGIPSIAAEHFPRLFVPGLPRTPRQALRALAVGMAERRAVSRLHNVALILAETEALREDLITRVGLQRERVRSAPLGVDAGLFSPRDAAECRKELGLPPEPAIWLYVGGMDTYHDMRPCLQAVGQAGRNDLLVLLLGTGVSRWEWERAAGRAVGETVRFLGTVPHERVPAYIGAADLCLAPYSTERFPRRAVTFSTLKVREYMACGRPVVTVPSGTLCDLVADGETGLVFDNTPAEWRRFLASPPGRDALQAMFSRVAERAPRRSWRETGADYLAACRAALGAQPLN
jgi:glycosyltransferase involved in cell wall biosynthesis